MKVTRLLCLDHQGLQHVAYAMAEYEGTISACGAQVDHMLKSTWERDGGPTCVRCVAIDATMPGDHAARQRLKE